MNANVLSRFVIIFNDKQSKNIYANITNMLRIIFLSFFFYLFNIALTFTNS